MSSKLAKVWLLNSLAALAVFLLAGCSSPDEAVSETSTPNQLNENTEEVIEEYESKIITYNGIEIYIPSDWSEKNNSVNPTITSSDNGVTINFANSPIEGAPDDDGLVAANNAKLVYAQFCEGNGFAKGAEIKYKVVNGYPCYYTDHFLYQEKSTPEGSDIYGSIYVVGFLDHCPIVFPFYKEGEQGLADAILDTLTATESAPESVSLAVKSLDAKTNPADLYNLKQEILAEAKESAQAEKERLKQQEPTIGMTESEVLKSAWGTPEDKNVTITRYGTHEQWVYSRGRYVYFDDGVVSAIQK